MRQEPLYTLGTHSRFVTVGGSDLELSVTRSNVHQWIPDSYRMTIFASSRTRALASETRDRSDRGEVTLAVAEETYEMP